MGASGGWHARYVVVARIANLPCGGSHSPRTGVEDAIGQLASACTADREAAAQLGVDDGDRGASALVWGFYRGGRQILYVPSRSPFCVLHSVLAENVYTGGELGGLAAAAHLAAVQCAAFQVHLQTFRWGAAMVRIACGGVVGAPTDETVEQVSSTLAWWW